MLVLLDVPGRGTSSFDVCSARPLEDLAAQASARLGAAFPWDSAYVAGRNGLSASEALAASSLPWLALRGRLVGGKGGFGSTLRSQGSRMSQNKPNDFDDCRDLYGRRLRTLKEAKSITEKLEREESAREGAAERRRKKIADGLKDRPAKKHRFDDADYTRNCEEIAAATKEATKKALRRARREKSPPGHQEEPDPPPAKAPLVPLFEGDISALCSSSESDDDDSSSGSDTSSSHDKRPADE
ncbi:hypothetical protein LPJ61_000748 [Coemansia biformis]|uniref:SDE2-like domain-containing protein n=1 Tax=Coemansia biformis TaxID=1286918 RepID=A0A9W7YHR4_9FUNG|nr:hypothetical protein LPJ61_000748 [Coemansia biformis]